MHQAMLPILKMCNQEVFRWEKKYSANCPVSEHTELKNKTRKYSFHCTIGITVKLIDDAYESQNRWTQKGTKDETYGKAVNEGFGKIRVAHCSRNKQRDNTSMSVEDNVHIFPKLHSWESELKALGDIQDKIRKEARTGSAAVFLQPKTVAWELLVTD